MNRIKRMFIRKSDLYSPVTAQTNSTLGRWHENEQIQLVDYWEYVIRRRLNTGSVWERIFSFGRY